MLNFIIVLLFFIYSCSNNSSQPVVSNIIVESSENNVSSISSSASFSDESKQSFSSKTIDSTNFNESSSQDNQISFSDSNSNSSISDTAYYSSSDTVVSDSLEDYLEVGKIVYDENSVVYKQDFNDLEIGQYNQDEIKSALGVSFCNGADEGRVWINHYSDRGHVLEAKYPKGQVKTSSSGFHTKIIFDNEYDELYMSYWVYFPEDFDFRAGGKLPGLAYQTDTRNMSLRLMWRYNGLIEYYVHYNTKPNVEDFHASINWSLIDTYHEPDGMPQPDQAKFKTGQWNNVILYYKLNTPGEKNGIMRGWLNGKLSIDITDNGDYRQIGEDDIMLNAIYLSTFFGGTDSTFQPQKDQYAFFDDIVVSTDTIKYIN